MELGFGIVVIGRTCLGFTLRKSVSVRPGVQHERILVRVKCRRWILV